MYADRARGGNFASIQGFLIASTAFLYLVAAGLFSKGVWFLESNNVRDNRDKKHTVADTSSSGTA